MAVDPKKLTKDDRVVLNVDFKTYPKGTELVVHKTMEVGKSIVVMAQVPDSDARPMGFQPDILDLLSEDAGPELANSPVEEVFESFAPDNDLAANFGVAYIQNVSDSDMDVLTSLMEQHGVDAGATWTDEQTAQMFRTFSEMMSLDEDPIIAATLDAPPPAAKPEKKATAAATKGAAKGAAETSAPAAAAKPASTKVNNEGWDGDHHDALRLTAAMLPIYVENPGNFDAVIEKAKKMVAAAAKVK